MGGGRGCPRTPLTALQLLTASCWLCPSSLLMWVYPMDGGSPP